MNVENNHTAETESEQTEHGNDTITIQTTLGDEDEDVHKCGRCQTEFSTLEAFIQHKLHHSCKRPPEAPPATTRDTSLEVAAAGANSTSAVKVVEGSSSDEQAKSNTKDETKGLLGRGRRRRVASPKAVDQPGGTVERSADSADSADGSKPVYKVNQEGRYICQLCEKTFKTSNILRTHMNTHSEQKNFTCDLCGTTFRTKGSLIRHNRRHTDERPYRCNLCGQSFRESGALTRHLKSLTPCTEKIRFIQYKEILVSKDGIQKGVEEGNAPLADQQEVMVVEQQPEEQEVVEAQTAVVSVVEAGSQEVIHQVHFTMEVDGAPQEQVLVEQCEAEALAAAAAVGDNLICQAIINSGIALETGETGAEETAEATEDICKVVIGGAEVEDQVTEIQVKEECVKMETEETCDGGDDQTSSKLHKCPHCHRSFKGLNYLRFHVKGHLGYKPFRCTLCQKEFLTGYLLKKHMEVHVSERRYKCGECGKLYKTIGHVREHMRAHSDERPYHCTRCNKGYKTKNALQVHQRTHGEEKPYVCQFCLRGFREKGSLVRHIRHHTGEKPFKCPKCGRGFAEHGTLNRHLRAKGGCHKEGSSEQQEVVTEEQESADNLTRTAIISEDPHAVLVEFSSVVADTQEYIIGTPAEEAVQGEEVTLIQDSQNQMGNHIMKVVQQIVSQSRGGSGTGGHQIIVRNMAVDEEGASISDCGDTITIATPESLTEQVAMTLASAISDGTLMATAGTVETADGTVTMVTATEEEMEQGIEVVQQQEEYIITSPEEVEVQTVIV
ncbi:transcription factor E4F1 [Myripristis murdjan]|uniref:Transcription factor E4F1 n=1 Tax=Myripristis murdjan TaxID=586833 RepID=A0A667Z3L0_9TELE|nr:transcription factor E4F1 [Myripristis murdjan]